MEENYDKLAFEQTVMPTSLPNFLGNNAIAEDGHSRLDKSLPNIFRSNPIAKECGYESDHEPEKAPSVSEPSNSSDLVDHAISTNPRISKDQTCSLFGCGRSKDNSQGLDQLKKGQNALDVVSSFIVPVRFLVQNVYHVLIPGRTTSLGRLYHQHDNALTLLSSGKGGDGGHTSNGGSKSDSENIRRSDKHKSSHILPGFGVDRGREFFGRLLHTEAAHVNSNRSQQTSSPMVLIIGLPFVGKSAVARQLVSLLAEPSLPTNEENIASFKRSISTSLQSLRKASFPSLSFATVSWSSPHSAATAASPPAPVEYDSDTSTFLGSPIEIAMDKLNVICRKPCRGVEIYPKSYKNGTGDIVVIHINDLSEGLLSVFQAARAASGAEYNNGSQHQIKASTVIPPVPSASLSAEDKADLLEFARGEACTRHVFPEESSANLIIVTDTLYDKRGSKMAQVLPAADSACKYRTSARITDRQLMPIYLECETEENVRRLEARLLADHDGQAAGKTVESQTESTTILAAELATASKNVRDISSNATFYTFRDQYDLTRRLVCGRQIATTKLTVRGAAEEIKSYLSDVENGVSDYSNLGPISFAPSDPIHGDEPSSPYQLSVTDFSAHHNDGVNDDCDNDHNGSPCGGFGGNADGWTVLTKMGK